MGVLFLKEGILFRPWAIFGFFGQAGDLLSFKRVFSDSSELCLLGSSLLFVPVLGTSVREGSSGLAPYSQSFESSALHDFAPYSSRV